MENDSRIIKVTLQQAKEWYYSGNKALQEIALNAYTEDELVFTLDTAIENIPINTVSLTVPIHKENQIREYIKLSILAEYFNKGWKKNLGNTGYFIGVNRSFIPSKLLKKINEDKSIGVVEHISVAYPEIIYFKNKEDLIRASKFINLEEYIG